MGHVFLHLMHLTKDDRDYLRCNFVAIRLLSPVDFTNIAEMITQEN